MPSLFLTKWALPAMPRFLVFLALVASADGARRETCDSLARRLGASFSSGTHTVGTAAEPFAAWCEATGDGGAWTVALTKGAGAPSMYTPSRG
jgi:hypothetical protein